MVTASDIRHGRHCVFNLHTHLVFLTKYRRHVFTKTILEDMRRMFTKICQDFEAELIEFEGEDNHVHLLVNYPPKMAISSLVNSLKGASSRTLRKRHPDLECRYWNGVLWSPSYLAASYGGAPISLIRQYIEQQNTPD